MRRVLLFVLTAALAVAPGLASAGDTRPPVRLDEEADCFQATPHAAAVPGVTDDGSPISLEVLVLLDGTTHERATAVFQRAADSYAPLGIELRVVKYRRVTLPADEVDADGTAYADSGRMIEDAKALVGGTRPSGTDMVYVFTNKDLTSRTNGTAVAGQADCIGGVRYPEHAFAVGEDYEYENTGIGPITFYVDGTAKIAAHEIGHLMGGHHHYANCAQGIHSEDVDHGEPSPCTLMSNFVDFGSIQFGVVNGAIVRGHAADYATP